MTGFQIFGFGDTASFGKGFCSGTGLLNLLARFRTEGSLISSKSAPLSGIPDDVTTFGVMTGGGEGDMTRFGCELVVSTLVTGSNFTLWKSPSIDDAEEEVEFFRSSTGLVLSGT